MTGFFALAPIGVVRGGRTEIFKDHWGPVEARLILDPAVLDPGATAGLSEFSHIEVVFHFDRETRVRRGASHPRGNPAWPRVGVPAGHSPVRPNHLGISRCELLRMNGLELTVRGLDAIDGTPILDIKPYATGFQPAGPVREPARIRELMRDYYRPAGNTGSDPDAGAVSRCLRLMPDVARLPHHPPPAGELRLEPSWADLSETGPT